MTAVSLKKPTTKKKPAPKSTPFASVDDIKLGMKVREPSCGLIGITTMRTEMLSGCVQYAIQPEGDGKSSPDAVFYDDLILEYVDAGVSARIKPADPKATLRVGEEARDTVTGFKGILIERTTHLNGCVTYTVQPQQRKASFFVKLLGEPARATHFDYKRLEKISDGVAKPLPVIPVKQVVTAPPPPPPAFQRSGTGGPSRSAAGYGRF